MAAGRRGRLLKATALVPLAALSAVWTASIAGVGGVSPAVAEREPSMVLPDGTTVPSQAIEAPASVTADQGSLATPSGNAAQIVSTSSTSGIPSAALAAYQRAETVINSADPTCQLPWQLVAAIGRVESNHGRAGGNVLDDQGLATPGIYGVPLDGTNSTTTISDTDAGQYDNDTVFDRAIGPMQFIPSTWSVVGVDADGDGTRNPQDVDDAALGTAVYLCSGNDDLSTPAGQQAAVFRYNHSQSYVDLVLSVMQAYLSGDFTAIPNGAVAAGVLAPLPALPEAAGGGQLEEKLKTKKNKTSAPTSTPAPTPAPVAPTTSAPAQPQSNAGDGKTANGSANDGGKKDTDTKKPVKVGDGGGVKVDTPVGQVQLPQTNVAPVDKALTLVEATLQCTTVDKITVLLSGQAALDKCIKDYMNP